MSLEDVIRREILLAARRAAKRITDLMLGSQVVDEIALVPVDLVANLAD